MKNILKSFTGVLLLLFTLCQQANAFCGFGGIFGSPPAPTCTCSSNKVAIKLISSNVCLEERCISQGAVQHYLNQGWVYGCCSSTRMGNESQSEETFINIFPNPASSLVTTMIILNNAEHVTIKLFDINSKLISIISDKVYNEGKNQIEYNVSDLNDGVYFLHICSDDIQKMEKLVIAR